MLSELLDARRLQEREVQHQLPQPSPPVWSSNYKYIWTIRVYKTGDNFRACFFKVDLYHDDVTASSLVGARLAAMDRIDALIAQGI